MLVPRNRRRPCSSLAPLDGGGDQQPPDAVSLGSWGYRHFGQFYDVIRIRDQRDAADDLAAVLLPGNEHVAAWLDDSAQWIR